MSDKPTSDVLADLMSDIKEYFDSRADAEYFTDSPSPHPNEEMRLLTRIRELPRPTQDCARCADLEAALDGCLESMEWSTPQGWHAFDRARAARKGEG
jgi:hypothetical protein